MFAKGIRGPQYVRRRAPNGGHVWTFRLHIWCAASITFRSFQCNVLPFQLGSAEDAQIPLLSDTAITYSKVPCGLPRNLPQTTSVKTEW